MYSQSDFEQVALERVRLWEEEIALRRLLAQIERPAPTWRQGLARSLGQAWARMQEWGEWRAQRELALAENALRRTNDRN